MSHLILLILGIERVISKPDTRHAADAASRHVQYRSRFDARRAPTTSSRPPIRWIRSMTKAEPSDPHPFEA